MSPCTILSNIMLFIFIPRGLIFHTLFIVPAIFAPHSLYSTIAPRYFKAFTFSSTSPFKLEFNYSTLWLLPHTITLLLPTLYQTHFVNFYHFFFSKVDLKHKLLTLSWQKKKEKNSPQGVGDHARNEQKGQEKICANDICPKHYDEIWNKFRWHWLSSWGWKYSYSNPLSSEHLK